MKARVLRIFAFFKIKTIFQQLLLSHLAIVFVSVFFIGSFTLFAVSSNSFNSLNYYLTIEARKINLSIISKDNTVLKYILSGGFWVVLYNSKNQVVYSSVGGKNSIDFVPEKFSEISLQTLQRGRPTDFKFKNEVSNINWYFVCRPYFDAENNIKGTIQVGLPLISIRDPVGTSFYILLFFAIILSGGTVFVIYFLSKWISSPIKLISSGAKKFVAEGKIQEELPRDRSDEIGELARSFNSMALSLESERNFQKEFIANASHELKTPVMSISSALEILENNSLKEFKDSGESQENREYFFDILKRQSRRLTELTESLLDMSALETGKVTLNKTEFKLIDLFEECVKDLELISKNAKIDFSWFVQENFIIFADKQKLARVINNLLTNAIKNTPEAGEVFLEAMRTDKNEVEIIVKDTGVGISKEDQEKIFSRFYRVQSDRSRVTGGTGLGLAIAQQIILLHNSKLEINSVLGEGTEFKFKLKLNSN